MSINIKMGSIFKSEAPVIVNPVNCFGVMGAGLALQFKVRYPYMFSKYKEDCLKGKYEPGKLFLYNSKDMSNSLKPECLRILNFPTKKHWKDDSDIRWIEDGLKTFVDGFYETNNITHVAFPLLGTGKGNLPITKINMLMQQYLSKLPINVELWTYVKGKS